MTYVEGYGWPTGLSWPVPHAWLVDDKEAVIDLTWLKPETAIYFGVPVRGTYVREVAVRRKECAPLIDALCEDWPGLEKYSWSRRPRLT